jgi:MFS transporter, DHA1 family, multidrug resistance protein
VTRRVQTAEAVLYLCTFLHVFAETLFAPFYPQLFAKAFGVKQLEYTGLYVAACRLTVVAFAPVWAWLSRRFDIRWLLLMSQLGTAAFTACLPATASETQFLLLSVALLAFKSGYLLVYSLVVKLAGEERRARAVSAYQGLFHSAIIASTLASVWAIHQLTAPLRLFYAVALLDLAQVLLCLYALSRVSVGGRPAVRPASGMSGLTGLLIPIGFLVFTFHLASNLIRPYFTAFTGAEAGLALSPNTSAVLFLLPSAMALAVMPAVRRLGRCRRQAVLYTLAVALLSASTLLQGLAKDLISLLVGRIAFGLFFVVVQALLEMRLFRESGTNLHFNYGVMVAVQNGALLAAPVLASALVDAFGLAAPLLGAAAIYALNLAGYRLAAAAGEGTQSFPPVPKESNSYAGRNG